MYFLFGQNINAGNHQLDSETTFERRFCWPINGGHCVLAGLAIDLLVCSIKTMCTLQCEYGIVKNITVYDYLG